MIISIIGWYGTETMGDRAILDGIFRVLNIAQSKIVINIGSLYPFYTERTIWEEKEIFEEAIPDGIIKIFNSKEPKTRKQEIESSDVVIIGGGPLMDLAELHILEDCFKIAKKKNIPRLVMGCGIGPLKNDKYIDVVGNILNLASAVSLRDSISVENALKLYGQRIKYECLGDPAIISVLAWRKLHKDAVSKDYISVNLRDYPQSEYGGIKGISDDRMICFLKLLRDSFQNIEMVPMHTFAIGGDDRAYMGRIIFGENTNGISIEYRPKNLYELYEHYSNAVGCVGMRYHSVVMQTILNGNNVILDYTDPQSGKISGFIHDINGENFYKDRMINIQKIVGNNEINELAVELKKGNRFVFLAEDMLDKYVAWFRKAVV